ncbi:hypothetical protein GCM10010913_30870 [Paenibacillus aceti]|uniref:DUF2798 domain-containing protein n=1 Tax=Paenibacillus aceti TaxID=1820010 RepID=A0ABQ1VZB3_9BACL|nr:hypothetical protein GCM10010913_30870 [Paenibacillus aceti]
MRFSTHVLNVILAFGEFNKVDALTILKTLPIMWITAMILEPVLVDRIAEKLVAKFTESTDSFNAKILFRILFTVIGMSARMMLIGGIVGNGFHSEIFSNFLTNWPRNLLVVLIAESLVIQPIARFAMVKIHASQDKVIKTADVNAQ